MIRNVSFSQRPVSLQFHRKAAVPITLQAVDRQRWLVTAVASRGREGGENGCFGEFSAVGC